MRVDVGDDLPLVIADPGLLERVIANLVSNAVKAAAGRPVEVPRRVRRRRPVDAVESSTTVRASPPAERDRVFAPFQRLDDKRADGGLGLGLAIARGFTEAMGGTLTPTETAGGGLTMTVSLPVAPSARSPEAAG